MATASPFATFLIIGPTCFFLGILFASFPYDYFVLWSRPTTADIPPTFPTTTLIPGGATRPLYIDMLEHHTRVLHGSPPLISRILHTVIGTALIGILMKLYKPSEANMLFDGATLVLYLVGITVYMSNIVKGMRVVTAGIYGAVQDPASKAAEKAAESLAEGEIYLSRDDSLKVLAASNTILALVLVGVLILQAGQWYAQKKEDLEIAEMDRVDAVGKKGKAAATPAKSESSKKKQ